MNVSLWRPWPPLPSFAQPVPPPGVEPDSGPCICVQFAPAWQPYILGALDQLTNAQTWDTSDSDVLSTTLAQVAHLREMFGASTGCSTPPPAPPITPTDDIDCKIASYLVRTVAKEILQAAINIAFPPAEGLSLIEYLLDAIPDVGDFLGIFGLTSKSLSTTILGYVTLPWVETATEDTVWDAIGCTVYNGVQGVHSITDGVLAVIQPAIEALDVAFPEFLSAVASIFGDLGSDVLTATAELANVTDFNCSGCGATTPVITGTNPQTYLARPLEVRDGSLDVHQVRRVTFVGGTLAVDSGTTDEVTYTPATDTGPTGPKGRQVRQVRRVRQASMPVASSISCNRLPGTGSCSTSALGRTARQGGPLRGSMTPRGRQVCLRAGRAQSQRPGLVRTGKATPLARLRLTRSNGATDCTSRCRTCQWARARCKSSRTMSLSEPISMAYSRHRSTAQALATPMTSTPPCSIRARETSWPSRCTTWRPVRQGLTISSRLPA